MEDVGAGWGNVGAGWGTWGRVEDVGVSESFVASVSVSRAALSLSFVQVRWDSEDDVTMKALTASRCVCPSSELHRSTKHA